MQGMRSNAKQWEGKASKANKPFEGLEVRTDVRPDSQKIMVLIDKYMTNKKVKDK